jgi:Alpha-glutamyl/putrescinyl thymine pyrophosphorylase clade 3
LKDRDAIRAAALRAGLLRYVQSGRVLEGIDGAAARETFVEQLIDSLHRVKYPETLAARPVSPSRAEPADRTYFDPIRAALFHFRQGDVDEACWLVFLFVHFGKHSRGGYRYLRDVYGRLGQGGRWDWLTLSANVQGFITWLANHHNTIRTQGGPGGFGNHRKYESLKPTHTGRVIESYVAWIDPVRGHAAFLSETILATRGDPRLAFNMLYESMRVVNRFGRTARFDYLAMIGNLGIAPIKPASAYLKGATGPQKGARLLYGVGPNVLASTLEVWLRELDVELQVGPQVLEDAICNWQKSPTSYRAFRG